MSKNDIAWNKLFVKYNILQKIQTDGIYYIKSDDINIYRESRLMTKFDHSLQLPQIFKQHKLSILPISRKEYIIAPIQTFAPLQYNSQLGLHDIIVPPFLESLNYNNITNEAMAINCAYASGIIADFTEESELFPTISGRMSSQKFNFEITSNIPLKCGSFKISVENSQIEIDGGYEGKTSLSIIEAKNSINNDFLIRQLYYPYRLWTDKISKKVKPIFMIYTNGIFYLKEYKFTNKYNYSSITLVKEKKYRLTTENAPKINIQTLYILLQEIEIINEPINIPFPQADSFERIINLCEIINNSDDNKIYKENLKENYSFTEQNSFDLRQVDYYTNAAIYLDLITKGKDRLNNIYYSLTEYGKSFFNLDLNVRQIKFVETILRHAPFNETLKLYLDKAEVPSKTEVVSIMRHFLNTIESESTFVRRASTIIAWLNWIINLIEE